MRTKTAFIMCCVLGIPAADYALTFDVRGGYRAGSYSYESRYKVSQGWETGRWTSMGMDSRNSENNHQGNRDIDKADGPHSFGDSTVDYNGIETNHSWPPADKQVLQLGGIYHWSNKGIRLRPYLRVNYKAMPDPTFGLRHRYDYSTYKTVNNTGESRRDSVNRLGLYIAYKLNVQWNALYQGTVYRYVNDDYEYKNDKSLATESVLTLCYKWNDWFSPYIEYDYPGKQGYHGSQNKILESRCRTGMTLTL